MNWIAQSTPVDPFIPSLVQQGVLALVLVLMIFGWIMTKPSVEQERKLHNEAIARMNERIAQATQRAEKAEEQRDRLLEQIHDTLPVVQASTEASSKMIPMLHELIERLEGGDDYPRPRRRGL